MILSKERKGVIFLLTILAILVGVIVAVSASLKVNPISESLKNDPVVKALWVFKNKDNDVLATDVLIYYPQSERATAFDILGNTGAIYSSLGVKGRVDRIDAVYREKGISVYKNEIEKLIGKSIPFVIEVSEDQLSILADLLGGISVFVSRPVDMQTESGERYLLPSGAVILDGDKIRSFLNYRLENETDSDVEDRRQSAFISFLSAIRENRNMIFNSENFPVYSKNFNTNLKEADFYELLEQIANIDTERLTLQTVTGSLRTVDGKTLLFPYYDGQLIKDIMNQSITSLVVGENSEVNRVYVLIIQNGTSQQGLARNTAFLMQSAGYEIFETSNADKNDYEETVIINHIGNTQAAESVGGFIHCTNIVDDSVKPDNAGVTAASKADFTIILGRDFDGRYVRSRKK